ncbi:hypothetical protein [Paenibacillus radicis (ex Xue et al. 2023)]|uniref:VWA domain-containing protein n=1 Tax=Paenibacillus radicis (ex Xue et al. 2023) TaxID=2972489 RepID=A0ABT1YHB2_9BACL|nr:hypothetical protein [Paenibacillus radicis (ex Xue et al. 2023)]MCR8631799.1 hypothetical protein [Paenibacillus radicis (ex Xue et al. 2023)]
MIIQCARIDRYIFDGYVHSSRTAQEWVREVQASTAWFSVELFADFFMCFYLPKPEIDRSKDAAPFHRWLIGQLRKQFFYLTIHPRTIGEVNASFKTALKALMWLTASYSEEVTRRKQDEQLLTIGLNEKKQMQGQDSSQINEHLTEKQIEKLKLVGYTLQQGKQNVEDKQAGLDSRPLVEAEIIQMKERIQALREEVRTDFLKRDKAKQKLKKAETELEQRERQLERFTKRDRETFRQLEEQLGQWLSRSLKESLSREDHESLNVHELLQASQRIANRKWGSDLGRLHRQEFNNYLQWIDKLKRHPELVAFLQEVGRNLQHLKVQRKKMRSPHIPEAYDDLRQSGDISHMLASEASLLADEDYEMYFAVKWLDRKLLTYNISGFTDEPQRGPVICMLDTSHSMRGSKLRVAQIFVATFAAFSLLERRDFVLLLFGARGELVEQPLYWRKPDWPAFYALTQLAFGGGTHFDAPIRRGIELVEGHPRFADADFVMVTDGIGTISVAVRQQLAELGARKQVRLHSLIIGSARRHLVNQYDILGVSHQVRFAATWESQDTDKNELLLDVFRKR